MAQPVDTILNKRSIAENVCQAEHKNEELENTYTMNLVFNVEYFSKYRQIVNFDAKYEEMKIHDRNHWDTETNSLTTDEDINKFSSTKDSLVAQYPDTNPNPDYAKFNSLNMHLENLKGNGYGTYIFDDHGYQIRNVVEEIIKEMDTYALAQEIPPVYVGFAHLGEDGVFTYDKGFEGTRNNWYGDKTTSSEPLSQVEENVNTDSIKNILDGSASTIESVWVNTDLKNYSDEERAGLHRNNTIQVRNTLLWHFDDPMKAQKCVQHIMRVYPELLSDDKAIVRWNLVKSNSKTGTATIVSNYLDFYIQSTDTDIKVQ